VQRVIANRERGKTVFKVDVLRHGKNLSLVSKESVNLSSTADVSC